MIFPIEECLPIASTIIPLLLDTNESLLCSDTLKILQTNIRKDFYLVIKLFIRDTEPDLDADNNSNKSIDENIQNILDSIFEKNYGLTLQLASRIDILFATLLARILYASDLLIGIEKL